MSRDSISTDPAKVKSCPITTSIEDVRRFLGFVGYYRWFIRQDNKEGTITLCQPQLKNSSKRKYSMNKLQFLALRWAISETLHDHLYGNTFQVLYIDASLKQGTLMLARDEQGCHQQCDHLWEVHKTKITP